MENGKEKEKEAAKNFGGGRRTHVMINTGTASQVISAVDSNFMRTMTVKMLHTHALFTYEKLA